MSGTTAIAAFFKGTQFTVANIGDSRAVVGEKKGRRVIAYSLSIDQTPYRQDERERVKASGAVVMSCDQLEGIVPYHENWGVVRTLQCVRSHRGLPCRAHATTMCVAEPW